MIDFSPLLFTIERGGGFHMYYVEENLTMTENRKHYEMMYDRAHTLVKIEKMMDWSLVYH